MAVSKVLRGWRSWRVPVEKACIRRDLRRAGHGLRGQSVLEGVEGRGGFAFFGARSGGALRVV